MYKYLSVSLHLWLQQFLLIPQPNQYLRTGSMMIEHVCLNMHGKKEANPAPHACLFKTFHAWQHECSVMNADLDGASNLLITCWSENFFSIPFQAGSWHYHQREGVPSHFFLSSIGIKTVAQTTHAIKVYLYVWFMFDRSLFLFLLLFFLPAIHWCRLHMYIWKFKGIVCEKTFTVAPGLIGHWIFLWLDTLLLFLLGSCFSCCLLFICQWWFVAPDVKEKSALYWTDSILRSRPCTCQPIVHDRVILRDLDEVFHQFILLCPDEKWAYQTKKSYMPMSNVTHLDLQTHTHTHTQAHLSGAWTMAAACKLINFSFNFFSSSKGSPMPLASLGTHWYTWSFKHTVFGVHTLQLSCHCAALTSPSNVHGFTVY